MRKIVVMIPAYNEEKQIGNVIRRVKKILPKNADIVVTDDGSSDNTAMVAKKNGAKVCSFAGNRGLVQAFKKGIEESLKLNPDVIINMDADGQHDPKDLKKLIKPIINNRADLVIGSRFMGKIHSKSRIKYFGNIMFSKLISSLIRLKITDAQCGYRAFSPELARKVKIHSGYTYTQQMIVQAKYHKFKIIEVPVTEQIRQDGKSRLIKNPFSFAFRAGKLLITIIAQYYPLAFFSTIGFFLTITGVLIGLLTPRRILSSVVIVVGIQNLLSGLLFKVIKNDLEK